MKPRPPVPRISKKRDAQNKALGVRQYSTITAKPKPIKKRGARRARREAEYKSYLSSAAWKKLRLAVFERDGFRCVSRVPVPVVAAVYYPEEFDVKRGRDGSATIRCLENDETRTGKGLIADHLTYARFGHENLEDLRTLCRHCNERETVSTRANWQRG